jgi:hypothetical protein
MGCGNGKHSSATAREHEKQRLWELFARTGFPCALRALRELERQDERAAALRGVSAA